MFQQLELFSGTLQEINTTKKLITTLNAHSFNTLKDDMLFRKALQASDLLLPDGVSVVWATRILKGEKIKKIAGADLFQFEMERVHQVNGKCFFLGSSEIILHLIKQRAQKDFPGLQVFTYSPPFKPVFTEEENQTMIHAVNEVEPDVLFIGMTAPKQEKWSYEHFEKLKAGHICCIGAVFDFYAGTVKRAPGWMISVGMEWFYRLIREPRRLWRRYLIGNILFVTDIVKEKLFSIDKQSHQTLIQHSPVDAETLEKYR